MISNSLEATTEHDLTLDWVRLGGIFGLASMTVYVLIVAVDLPDPISAALAASFGPLLSLASYGIYRLLVLHRKSVSLQIGVVANAIAGALVTAMLMVQSAVRSGGRASLDDFLWTKLRRVDLGLDVAWDAYIILGTFLFAWNMIRHPRFGRVLGSVGIVLAVGLGVLNFATFPTPPAYAGLMDLGPLVGLWYVVVSVQLLRSRKWAKVRLDVPAVAGA